MNQQQKKYAIERVIGIELKKLATLRKDLSTKGITLSDLQRYHLVKNGDVQLKSFPSISKYALNSVANIYDFSNHEKDFSFDKEKFEEDSVAIVSESKKIQDEIMLGDAEEALELIQKFENM